MTQRMVGSEVMPLTVARLFECCLDLELSLAKISCKRSFEEYGVHGKQQVDVNYGCVH